LSAQVNVRGGSSLSLRATFHAEEGSTAAGDAWCSAAWLAPDFEQQSPVQVPCFPSGVALDDSRPENPEEAGAAGLVPTLGLRLLDALGRLSQSPNGGASRPRAFVVEATAEAFLGLSELLAGLQALGPLSAEGEAATLGALTAAQRSQATAATLRLCRANLQALPLPDASSPMTEPAPEPAPEPEMVR
jgi:hypothetical protein